MVKLLTTWATPQLGPPLTQRVVLPDQLLANLKKKQLAPQHGPQLWLSLTALQELKQSPLAAQQLLAHMHCHMTLVWSKCSVLTLPTKVHQTPTFQS